MSCETRSLTWKWGENGGLKIEMSAAIHLQRNTSVRGCYPCPPLHLIVHCRPTHCKNSRKQGRPQTHCCWQAVSCRYVNLLHLKVLMHLKGLWVPSYEYQNFNILRYYKCESHILWNLTQENSHPNRWNKKTFIKT